ncbi:hypothetical protein EV203_1506 [Caldanaerobacter subterraneus]|jgi:hypothetical protein|uniref:Uncharacterized protein n=1 Tax=Caldanaerobacter subterraneus TaxID=911092 RepID=A0A4R2JK50_9THEO|nr:hypothetical protein EV203_1506 [Caldanaerobacter subterraneus]
MIALFIRTTIIRVILIIMMKEQRLTANRAARVLGSFSRRRLIRSKLMVAFTAEIFLVTICSFAIFVKQRSIIAFWTG